MSEQLSDEKKLRLIKQVQATEVSASATVELERGAELLAMRGESESEEEAADYTSMLESRLPAVVTEEEVRQLEWETLQELKRVLAKY